MIKFISGRVAYFLCKDEDGKDNYELYEYAVYIILSSLLHVATIVALGLCFNLLIESLMLYFSFVAIRKFAGGYHAKTPLRCYTFSVLAIGIALLLLKLSLDFQGVGVNIIFISFALISLAVIIFFSPLDSENKTINSKERKIYRKISIGNSCVLFVISLFLLLFDSLYGYSIILGVCFSAIVLTMRKLQEIRVKNSI